MSRFGIGGWTWAWVSQCCKWGSAEFGKSEPFSTDIIYVLRISIGVCIYIYIYIYRGFRDRERERDIERERETAYRYSKCH
jgi:hypothetical protein